MEQRDPSVQYDLDLLAYFALIALTALTLLLGRFDLGRLLGVALALIVAAAKVGVIAFHFMNLRAARPVVLAAVGAGLFCAAALLFGIMPDLNLWPK